MTGPPAQAQIRDGFNQARIATDKKPPVSSFRAYGLGADGKRGELAATCTYSSDDFSGSVITPAQVTFPVITGEPDELVVVCTYGGQTGTFVAQPHFNGINPDAQTTNSIELAMHSTIIGVARSKNRWQIPSFVNVVLE